MFELTNKIALITGARRGMGKAHALMLARQGAKVIVTDINLEECQAVVDEIIKNGGEAIAYQLDVSDAADVNRVFTDAAAHFGRLDILVNNAGVYEPKLALDLTEEEWDRTIRINLKGEFLCAQRAAKEMMKNKWGRIINIASIASGGVGIGFPGAVHYAASKGGIVAMTESMAIEWASLGITANVIAPGAIDTPMVHVPGKQFPTELTNEILQRVPLKRMGRSEEVAAAVVFLASEESSYITGATFYVDGGWLAM